MAFRILHIGKFFPPERGGMETYLADLMHQQRSHGIDARALVHGRPQPDDPAWLQRLRVHIRLIFTPIALGFPWAIHKSLRRFAPDVLHLHMPNVAVFWLLLSRKARRVPWVVHWHSDVTFTRSQTALALAYRLYRPLESAVLAQARFIIATSPPYLEASQTLRPWREKCVAIALGLQAMPQQTSTAEAPSAGAPAQASALAQARPPASEPAPMPWRSGKLRVLSIGRLTYYKGFETLIRAIASLPHVQLCIVGDGDLRAPLQALVQDLRDAGEPTDITLLGEVSEHDKHRLLASCDVFALASRARTEAFGLALVEAMQFGKPCIVSDLHGSGMPWLVRQSGAGLCVPLDDIAAWRQALEQLRGDSAARARFGQAGRLAAQQLFSIGANSDHVHRLYASLVPEYQQRQRGRLIAVPMRQRLSPSQLDALAQRWQALGQGDVLLINEASGEQDFVRYLNHWGLRQGVAVVHTPWQGNRLGAVQTAMRWALRQGHAALLHIPAELACNSADWPVLARAVQALLQQAQQQTGQHPQAQVLQAVPGPGDSHPGGRGRKLHGWANRWFVWLTGAPLQADFAASLQLYQRPAMQKAYQMRLSLLDQPEMGLLLMARQARLPTATIALPELAQLASASPGRLRRSLSLLIGGTLMYLAKWHHPRLP